MFASIALAFHILAAVVWIGGMFFAYVCLRPVLGGQEPPARLKLWAQVFGKFFPWVWMCIFILFLSGFYLISVFGGFDAVGTYVYAMLGLAVLMTAIFKFVYIAPFRHLKAAVEKEDYKVAGFALGTIRKLVATNLCLGIAVIVIATGLKAWH